jgi:putative transposase
MSEIFYLSPQQFDAIKPHLPYTHERLRCDDLRVISGIIHVLKRGLQWRDAPCEYGIPKTLYNRFIRWSRMGVFDKIFASLVEQHSDTERLMIDATHLKTHRTASSLLKKGMFKELLAAQKEV